MNEDNNTNYYAIIPATIRYNEKLKPNEKLLYGELTALSNKYGYCYAQNRYFANLYRVNNETVSRWLSHLQELGFIRIEIKRNEKKEIIARYIYIVDTAYCQKNQYPYCLKNQEGIDEKVKVNIINKNIDDLFYSIIERSYKIPKKFYLILNNLEFLYTKEILQTMKPEKVEMLKNIIYVLYDIFNSEFGSLLSKTSRESLLNLYILSQEHMPSDLLNYYKRVIINKYTNTT